MGCQCPDIASHVFPILSQRPELLKDSPFLPSCVCSCFLSVIASWIWTSLISFLYKNIPVCPFLTTDHITVYLIQNRSELSKGMHCLAIYLSSSSSSLFFTAHLLNSATSGKVCSAEGDSGRMSAQPRMLSPFFSTTDL